LRSAPANAKRLDFLSAAPRSQRLSVIFFFKFDNSADNRAIGMTGTLSRRGRLGRYHLVNKSEQLAKYKKIATQMESMIYALLK